MKATQATKHVLIVEPDSVQASLIASAVGSEQLQTHIVAEAQTAISAADKNKPSLVIVEIALPSHNGIEFLHEFRSYPEWMDIPVVVFSQQHVDNHAIFHSLGNVTYLYKPRTSLANLKRHIIDLLA